MSVTFLLCRHGEAEKTGGITGGGLDPHLTESGKKQAEKLGTLLKGQKVTHVYHSGMHRAREMPKLLLKKVI